MGTSQGHDADERNNKLIVGYLRKQQELLNISIPTEIIQIINLFKSTGYKIFVIGQNRDGALGLGHEKSIPTLTQLKTKNRIKTIYQGHRFCIYKDEYDQYYSVGSNFDSQCCCISINPLNPVVTRLRKINPFKNNKMNKIKNVFTSIISCCVFWMDMNGNIYGNGFNKVHQLGLGKSVHKYKNSVTHPYKIDSLPSNIKSIKGSYFYTLALDNDGIVYSTGADHGYGNLRSYYGGHGHGRKQHLKKFTQIPKLCDSMTHTHRIIQIECGHGHSFLLDQHGQVFSMGYNHFGQCGVGNTYPVERPTMIKMFRYWHVKIKEIKCGEYHTLALDTNNKIYSWGANNRGQCGHGDKLHRVVPLLIECLEMKYVIEINCGKEHSYCKTDDDKHYLWGSNWCNECITNDDRKHVTEPFCINDMVDGQIQYVFVSHYNTKLFTL